MKAPNWRESNPELKAAWFEFKSKYTGAGTPCLSSFAAGWNTQKALAHREADESAKDAFRRGWEQARREAIRAVKSNPILYPAHVDGGIAWQYVIDSVAVDAIAAMEYKGKAND